MWARFPGLLTSTQHLFGIKQDDLTPMEYRWFLVQLTSSGSPVTYTVSLLAGDRPSGWGYPSTSLYSEFDAVSIPLTVGSWFHLAAAINTVTPAACNIVINSVNRNATHNGTLSNDTGSSYSIPINGESAGLPFNLNWKYGGGQTQADYQQIMEFSEVQLWFGQYIDWTDADNFAKVVKVAGGVGTPEDPAIAAAAFGTQQILFRGKASDASFYVNRGDGGAFTKTGTVTDFTPGPSY